MGFARPEADEVIYIATMNELNVDPYVDSSPRNWIQPQNRVPLEPQEDSKKVSGSPTKADRQIEELKKTSMATVKSKELQSMEERLDRNLDESQELKSTKFKVP